MKNIFFKGLALLLVLGFTWSCNKEPQDLVTQNAKVGGLVDVETPLHVYKKGETAKEFKTTLLVYQGEVKTNKIQIFKQFFTAAGEVSNIELLKTVDIQDKSKASTIEFTLNYAQLAENIAINGTQLDPNDDSNLVVGDAWVLTYKAETSEGTVGLNKATTKVGVSGRLAGVYDIKRGWYIHPSTAPNLAANYAGGTKVIESVSDGLYKMTTIGPWNDDNPIYFMADEDNFTITIPKEVNGAVQKVWGGADEVATCQDNPANLADVTCTNTFSYEADGHDVIKISYGYIRTSGTREFDEILIKQ